MRARLKWTRVNLMVECLRVPVVHQLVSSFHLVVPPFHSRWQSAHESWSVRRRSCGGGHGGVWSGPVLLFRPQTLGPLKWPGCTFSRGSIQSCGSIVGCEASSRHSALNVCGSIRPTTTRKITSRWARLACFGPFCHVKNGPVEGFRHYTEEYWMFGEGIWKKKRWKKSGSAHENTRFLRERSFNKNILNKDVQSEALIFRFHQSLRLVPQRTMSCGSSPSSSLRST